MENNGVIVAVYASNHEFEWLDGVFENEELANNYIERVKTKYPAQDYRIDNWQMNTGLGD